MVDKTVSVVELKRRQKDGARVDFGPERMQVENFGELIAALKGMSANEQARITEALSRNQTNLEILATLQQLIRREKPSSPAAVDIDLTSLDDILATLVSKAHTHALVAYDFDFIREGNGGRTVRIRATPVKLQEG